MRADGDVGRLRGEIQHYAYRDVSHHLATIDRYTTLAADQWRAEGRRTSALAAVVHPPLAFLRNYLLRGGIRDGQLPEDAPIAQIGRAILGAIIVESLGRETRDSEGIIALVRYLFSR